MKNTTTTTAQQAGITEPVTLPESIGDTTIEGLLEHLTVRNPNFNTLPLLAEYLKGRRLAVCAEYEFAPDPTNPGQFTKQFKSFAIDLEEPDYELEAKISHELSAKYYKGAPGSPRWL